MLFLTHNAFEIDRLFLLVREFGSTNVAAAQLHIEYSLHAGEHLLVGGGGASLEIGDDGLSGVAPGSEILLRHLGLHLLASLGDDLADTLANGVGLDDVVGSIDLGQTLTLASASGLGIVSVDIASENNRIPRKTGSCEHTALAVAYFFSEEMIPPDR